jgi:hypothetical protein
VQKEEAGIRNAVVTRTRQDLLENKNRRGLGKSGIGLGIDGV